MRVMVMFDLPVLTKSERTAYARFRRYLVKNGFIMMQESIYCKLAQNSSAADAIVDNVRKNKPPKGLVQAMKVTEKQYARIEFIVGEHSSEVLESDQRLVIL